MTQLTLIAPAAAAPPAPDAGYEVRPATAAAVALYRSLGFRVWDPQS